MLCFCFLIIDGLNKEDSWKAFFDNIDQNKYRIVVNAKFPEKVESEFLKKYLIKDSISCEWGKYELINAELKLYAEGLLLGCKNFILLSESHIPLHNFDKIWNELIKDDNEKVYYILNPKHGCHSKKRHYINNIMNWNLDKRWVIASQWKILTDKCVSYLIDNQIKIYDIFNKVPIPDEYALVTFLLETSYPNVINQETTFVNWKEKSRKTKYRSLPRTYDDKELCDNLIRKLKTKYLFMRKIARTCHVNNNLILN